MMQTIEVFLFIGLFLMVGYAFIRARKEVLKAKRVEDQVVDIETKISSLEEKVSNNYSNAEIIK